MKITINVITIAIKFDDRDGLYHYSIATYARINAQATNKFYDNFMREYDGNGIESITVLQNDEMNMYIEHFRDLEKLVNTLRKKYPGMNETILDY